MQAIETLTEIAIRTIDIQTDTQWLVVVAAAAAVAGSEVSGVGLAVATDQITVSQSIDIHSAFNNIAINE